MSKLETPLTRRYWREVGGTLIEEFPAVRRKAGRGQRLIDGVIITNGPFERKRASEVDVSGKDIIVVQTKANRLGMYLMGQAVFSPKLMERFNPSYIRSVAICTRSDDVLEPLLKEAGVEIVVYSADQSDQRLSAG